MVSLRYLEATILGALFMAIPVQSRLASPVIVKRLTPQYLGCYDSSQGLTKNDTNTFQSSGHCHTQCATGLDLPVMAMTLGSDCYCGQDMPPQSDKVSDTNCGIPCQGFPNDNCGGNHYWAVWNSGLQLEVTNLPESSSPTSASTATSGTLATPTASSPPSVVTIGGSTVVVTASTSSSSAASSNGGTSSGPNKAGIAAGVVVGIVVIAAAAGGIYLYIRARRRKEVEEEFMRQAAISSFVAGGKTGSSAGASHDTRLDPVIMTQRRMSDGSIADNEDYSRRILKVTNA